MMEPILIRLEAGGASYEDDPHEGEEFGYVISGSICVALGNQTYKVKKGESFYFTANKKHRIWSKTGASVLWVSAPPNF